MGDVSKRYEIAVEMKNHLYEEYGDRFESVKKVYPDFDEESEIRLGVLLENISEAFDRRFTNMLNEDAIVTAPHVVEGLKIHYFDIVTAVFPNLIAEQLFSVQPISQRIGEIFYLRYTYGTTKGTINRGDTIFGANYIAGYENSFYTQEHIEDEAGTSTIAGSVYDMSLDNYPVCPGSLSVSFDGAAVYEDDGKGNIILLADGSKTGNIDYSSGAIRIFGNFTAGVAVTATYDSTFESDPSLIPSIELNVDSVFIQARPRKLRGTYTFDAGYDLKQSQGIDIQDALLQAAAMQLKNETDGELIRTACDQAGATTNWNDDYVQASAHVAKKDYYENFIEHIFKQCSQIRQNTKRVTGNFIVCGKNAGDILQFIGAPRFTGSGVTGEVGPYYAGMLDNRIKVFIDPFLGVDEYLIGYKGNNLIDAGLIYAPYLIFFATETVMLDDFLGRRGFSTSYGKKMVNRNMYIHGMITHEHAPATDPEGN